MPIILFGSDDFTFYYTVTSASPTSASNPKESLGGIVSITPVSAGINNIFEKTNLLDVNQNGELKEYKCIVLKPNMDIYNVQLYIDKETESQYSIVNIAVEGVNPNSPEEIPDKFTQPDTSNFMYTFSHPTSSSLDTPSAIRINEVKMNENLYIWMEKVMTSASDYSQFDDIEEGFLGIQYETL